jgi:hypothetical protein
MKTFDENFRGTDKGKLQTICGKARQLIPELEEQWDNGGLIEDYTFEELMELLEKISKGGENE